jgi:hypothetical protein
MTGKPIPLNRSAGGIANPVYAEPVLGNPVSTLMDSGVGNCFPGLEFDLRQLDVRFFPGLVFGFPGITPAGPDGTQGARLIYADPGGDPLLADAGSDGPQWITDLNRQYAGPEGAALGDGDWYLFWVEQDGKRIEMYDYQLYQNAAVRTPYEGETCWWIIRLIEPEIPLRIALSQRDETGAPAGHPVVLTGRRRIFLDGEGMIDPVYHPGELTSSMCSPWTHDFRDCACHYWASNHPDVALGEVDDPQHMLENHTDSDDPAQAVTFVDWMRRRSLPLKDVSAQTSIETARPDRYDPYEINLKWQELDFVLQGQEMTKTPDRWLADTSDPYNSIAEMIADLSDDLAGLELTLALEYLYACFSLRSPDQVTPDQERDWPGLTGDLRAARQLLLSVALGEMTHLRWVNQVLWLVCRAFPDQGPYTPALTPAEYIAEPGPDDPDRKRRRALRPATPEVLQSFVEVERPDGRLDTEYIRLVQYLRDSDEPFPEGLYQLAVRIDSDGVQHYQKFRDIKRILAPYSANDALYLRPVTVAGPPYADAVQLAIDRIAIALSALGEAYALEAAQVDMPTANARIRTARDAMHDLNAMAEALARDGTGVPFFALWGDAP